MKTRLLGGAMAAVSLLALGACVTHDNTHEIVREQPIVREEVTTVQQAPAPAPVVREERTTTVHEQQPGLTQDHTVTTTTNSTTVMNDPHAMWWRTYHPGEAYDRDHAMALHRMWCDDHPADNSCAGWYARQ